LDKATRISTPDESLIRRRRAGMAILRQNARINS